MLCLGIDLSSSSKRASTLAFINDEGRLEGMDVFEEYQELLSVLDSYRPDVVAIGAPLGLPLGLDCLEEDCPCTSINNHKGRKGEVELARMGIGCFYTGKRSIIKNLIYRGVKFRKDLTQRGYEVVEAYPYATKIRVFGDGILPKSHPESLAHLREHVPVLVPDTECHTDGLNHQKYDAVLTAYTGYLHLRGKTDALGIPEEWMISIPKFQVQPIAKEIGCEAR